jgi:Kef-type K+ transport system membrane component KefB
LFHGCTSPFFGLLQKLFQMALHMSWRNACRVTVTLGGCLLAAMALTRSVLPRSLRFLATHSSAELFQLTVLAFCLVSAWISGYLVSLTSSMPCISS